MAEPGEALIDPAELGLSGLDPDYDPEESWDDYNASRSVDASGVRTLCLILGPYRNLTTLTASTVSLHPQCQVLNHAGVRVLTVRDVNFMLDYSDERFENFVRLAIYLCRGGKMGQHGGAITHSHAFGHRRMRETYAARFGATTVRDDVRSVLWKESMVVTNLIHEGRVDLEALLRSCARVRFLMPIRHPIDCAWSNQGTGHGVFLTGRRDASIEELLDRVLDEIAWFRSLQHARPDRFFSFFEDDVPLSSLAGFLEVDPDERWEQDARRAFHIAVRYDHPPALLEQFERSAARRFSDDTPTLARLRALVESA